MLNSLRTPPVRQTIRLADLLEADAYYSDPDLQLERFHAYYYTDRGLLSEPFGESSHRFWHGSDFTQYDGPQGDQATDQGNGDCSVLKPKLDLQSEPFGGTSHGFRHGGNFIKHDGPLGDQAIGRGSGDSTVHAPNVAPQPEHVDEHSYELSYGIPHGGDFIKDDAPQPDQVLESSYGNFIKDEYVQKVVEHVGALAVSVYPERLIVMLSVFTGNSYKGLIGDRQYEPDEEFSMIGFRGGDCRTYPCIDGCLALELAAIKKVRDDMGLTNVEIMVPFGRSRCTAKDVDEVLEMIGLTRDDDGLKVNVMVELPSLDPRGGSLDAEYCRKMIEGVGMVAASVYPGRVIVHVSDFKQNGYDSKSFTGDRNDLDEKNPMTGFRDDDRYTDPFVNKCLALELEAIKTIRGDMGLTNVDIVIPSMSTLNMAKAANEVLEENGLMRGEDGLKVHMMVELFGQGLLADDFFEYFDGFAIGNSDLLQLVPDLPQIDGFLEHCGGFTPGRYDPVQLTPILEGISGLVEPHLGERRAGTARGARPGKGRGTALAPEAESTPGSDDDYSDEEDDYDDVPNLEPAEQRTNGERNSDVDGDYDDDYDDDDDDYDDEDESEDSSEDEGPYDSKRGRAVFSEFASRRRGKDYMDVCDLHQALSALGHPPTEAVLHGMIHELDNNCIGSFDFPSFCEACVERGFLKDYRCTHPL